jgi:uncharacterized protein (TIGR01777 family)
MPDFRVRSTLPFPPSRVWAWHAAPGALERLLPPWDAPRVVSRTGTGLGDARVEMRMGPEPFAVTWVAQHHDAVEGLEFSDRAERGPFAAWDHRHRVDPAPGGGCVLTDHIQWALPLGLGAVGEPFVTRILERMFAFRHQRTREDLTMHDAHPPLRIAVSGASGLIGAQLVAFLTGGGHTVHRLVRRAPEAGDIAWDPARGTIDAAALEGVDAVVHLAGESVAGRWTDSRRAAIRESRVAGTALLARTLAGLSRPPRVFVSASAVGWYGHDRGEAELDEDSTAGTGFLAEVCRAWEAAADPARDGGIRVVHPRIGVVLSARGGALAQMLTPARMGGGGPIGTGRQRLSWIALDDVLGALLHCIVADVRGPVNLVAPNPVAQATFARTLGHVLHRPAVVPLPAFAVRAAFGAMGEEILLGGQRVLPRRLEASGYRFLRPTLEEALRFELGMP